MRKGFTLTLTTLAVALLATSVYAYGPTVGAVPDVWITEKTAAGAADGPQYMFRYSEAILLNDFVTPGVSTGDGSASDTLYWAWALRQSNGTAGSGAYLSGTDVVYNAVGSDSADVQPETPTFSPSGDSFTPSTWVSEVNGWAGKPTVADSGSLTFRNIRINATVADFVSTVTANAANTQLPAGYLDAQEATVFVTDGATTPGFDTFQLFTLLANAQIDRDKVSGGGPVYEVVEDYRTSTPSASWLLLGVGVSVHNGTAGPGPTSYVNNGTGTLTSVFPLANTTGTDTTDPYFPATIFFKAGISLTSDKVYRLSARAQSSNTVNTVNPSIGVSLNGRTSCGQSQIEASYKPSAASITLSPVAGSPITLKSFLWPAANGEVSAWYVIWDSVDTTGGTITLDQMLLESFDPTLLAGETTLADYGTGASTAFSGYLTGEFAFYNPNSTSHVNVTSAATANTISFTGQAGTSTATDGVGYALGPNIFTTSAGTDSKLVLVKVMAKTTSSDTARIPDLTVAVNDQGNYRATFMIDRYFANTTSTTVVNADADAGAVARPYYVILESLPNTQYNITFYGGVYFDDVTNGNITVERVTALEYDLPTE